MNVLQQLPIPHPRVTSWQDFQGSPTEAWVFFQSLQVIYRWQLLHSHLHRDNLIRVMLT